MAKKNHSTSGAGGKNTGRQNARERTHTVAKTERQQKIQTTLFEIADAASALTDMQSFYKRLHEIVGTLMYAENFFIALHDPQTDLITWPYYVDTVDIEQPEPIALKDQHGGTGWILRTGRTLSHAEGTVSYAIEHGEAEQTGTVSDAIGVPLKSDGKIVGALLIQSYRDEIKYDLKHVEIMNFVAQHISIALTRARANQETRQRNSELAIINSVQAALAAQLDMHGIYEAVGEKLREIFNYQDVTIYTGDLGSRIMSVEYTYERGQKGERQSVPLNSLYEYFMMSNKTFVFNNDVAPFLANFSDYQNPEPPKSLLAVPVRRNKDNEPVVYLTIQDWEGKKFFSNSDVRLMETLANSMSAALENARLFDETQRLLKETEDRAAELAVINSVQEGLASKLDMQSIYDLVGDKIREIFNADVVGIGFYDHNLKALNHPYIVDHDERYSPPPMPIPDDLVDYLKTHDATLINTYQEAENLMERWGIHNVGGPTPDNSFIVVPLMIGGEFMGRITVAKLPAYAFNQSDVRLLQTLVNSMSVALENARLWEQEKLYRKALQRELEIGREIQAGFLPEALPQIEGWEIAASLMSAREVAGDFYDAFELPDGTIGLVIADVCDKGVGAALFMTLFRSLIRAASNLDYFEHIANENTAHSPAERLKRAMSLTNNYIAETHEKSGMFATLFFGILDPRDGRLAYINGGHEPPLIIREGSVREILAKTGPAVGLILDGCFELRETALQAGEIFLAYTDGVPDCQSPRGDFYGRDNLLAVLREASVSSLDLVKAIEADLRQHTAEATRFDDVTLLAVRRS